MAVTAHPHPRAALHGPARIASLGAALTATALIGFVGVDALTDDGDRTPTPVVRSDPGPADPSFLGGPAATDTGGRSSVGGSPEQRAVLDQVAADMGFSATPAAPAVTTPAMPFDPGVAQGLTGLIPDGDG